MDRRLPLLLVLPLAFLLACSSGKGQRARRERAATPPAATPAVQEPPADRTPPPPTPTSTPTPPPAATPQGALAGPGLDLTAAEVKRILEAPRDSVLRRLRDMALRKADKPVGPIEVRANAHLSSPDKSPRYVPKANAMPLGFLREYNLQVDARGLAFQVTGERRYAAEVARHLRPWQRYSPPMGQGELEGGEPGVMHRNFYGILRAAYHAWPALDRDTRKASVHLCVTIQDRLLDWWAHTGWVRGNHQAATNQTGVYAALVLLRASATDPDLVSPAEAWRRLRLFTRGGDQVPAEAMVVAETRVPGSVGFERQVRYGIVGPDSRALCLRRYDEKLVQDGCSLDYLYKPSGKKMEYHMLVSHHLLMTWWALRRNGLDRQLLEDPAAVRAQLSRLVDFTRPYWESGRRLPGSSGKVPKPENHFVWRQVMWMAWRLFPEKSWIGPLLERGKPASFDEIYFAAADPMPGG